MSSQHPGPPEYPAPYPQQFPQQFPGAHPGPYQAPPSPTLAIVSLITGILSLVLVSVIGILALGLGIAAIVTGVLTLVRRGPGRGMAIAGTVTGGVGALVSIVLTVVIVVFYGSFLLFGLSGAFDEDSYSGSYGWSEEPYDDSYGSSVGEYGFGDSAYLDEYLVSVDAVRTVDDVVYADLTVTYDGPDAGDAYYDLYGYLYSADGESFSAAECDEPLDPDAYDLPDVAPGQTVTFQMCFEGVSDTDGAWVEVADGEGLGSYADWSDDVTLGGPSRTGV